MARRLQITSNGGYATYAFKVQEGGSIAGTQGPGNETANLTQEDQIIKDRWAVGAIGPGGTDAYNINGDVVALDISGPATASVGGTTLDPDTIPSVAGEAKAAKAAEDVASLPERLGQTKAGKIVRDNPIPVMVGAGAAIAWILN